MDENKQLQVRKFLKRLGINSQEKLHKYIEDNPDIKNIPVKVIFQINGEEYFNFEDNIKD